MLPLLMITRLPIWLILLGGALTVLLAAVGIAVAWISEKSR